MNDDGFDEIKASVDADTESEWVFDREEFERLLRKAFENGSVNALWSILVHDRTLRKRCT